MSTLEAAASLFGSSDSGSDFFTAPETPADSPAASNSQDLFSGQEASDLFVGASDENEASSLFPASGESNFTVEASSAPTHSEPAVDTFSSQDFHIYDYGYNTRATSADHTQSAADHNAQGWYDEYGHWHGHEQEYEQSVRNGSEVNYGASSSVSSYEPEGHADPYNGYSTGYADPAYNHPVSQSASIYTAYSYEPAASSYGAPSYVPPVSASQASYDPYQPTTTRSDTTGQVPPSASVYDRYDAPSVTHSQGSSQSIATIPADTYNPYVPSSTLSRSQPPSNSLNASFTGSNATSASEQSTRPPAPPYRPTSYNAYDPPLPAVKPKRSATAHVYQQSSPAPSQYISPPPPPPPPLRAATLVPQSLGSPKPPGPSSPHSASRYSSFPQNSFDSLSPATSSHFSIDSSETVSSALPPSNSLGNGMYHAQDDIYSPTVVNSIPQANGYSSLAPTHSYAPTNDTQEMRYSPRPLSRGYDSPERHGIHPLNQKEINHIPNPEPRDNSGSYYDDGSTDAWKTHEGNHQQYGSRTNLGEGGAFNSVNERRDSVSKAGSRQPSLSPTKSSITALPTSASRNRMSPGPPQSIGKTYRTSSPVGSDSGRSWTGSLGRSSSPLARHGLLNTTQTFSSLDERDELSSSSYDPIPYQPYARLGSPVGQPRRPGNEYAANAVSLAPTTYLDRDQNVIDLGSDTSSTYGRSTSPTFTPSHHQESATPVLSTGSADDYPFQSESSAYEPYSPRQLPPAQPAATASYLPPSSSDRYAPSNQSASRQNSYDPFTARERSMSNLSTFSASSLGSHNQYAPGQLSEQQQSLSSTSLGGYMGSSSFASVSTMGAFSRSSMESSHSPPPVTGPYAPSPSLLGTNDPLGRASAKVPVLSFGFGGKVITCFHTPPALETGFDVALSSRKCTDIHIRLLHKLLPESAMDESTAIYPGPLFGDPGSPVSTLVRTATSSGAKNKSKKAKVLAYLDERGEEIQRGLGYLTAGSLDKRRADGKLLLVRLLRALVDHDGQLYGSSEAEADARAALLPHLTTSGDGATSNVPTGAALATGSFTSAGSNEKPLAEYAVRPSALDVLQKFLLQGEKRKAYHYALDEKLWAHAMVISSSIDKDAFREVVNEFIRTELGIKPGYGAGHVGGNSDNVLTNGRESLRLAYSLYSGQSAAAVQQLLPPKLNTLVNGPTLALQPPTPMNHVTPLSPNFPSPTLAVNVPAETLSGWPEYAVMLFSGQMGPESCAALTTLGDYLLSNNWVEAAHCCYLLSPQPYLIGGLGTPSARIVLVGSHTPQRNPAFFKDSDSFIFSEIVEFALGLHSPAKGQEPFGGFPHLQVYRLLRALQLAELGHMTVAKRYNEAIVAASTRPSPYLSYSFSEQLREFSSRLVGDPELDKSRAWISGKIAKPSLDSIGAFLGGTLSKFVAGDAEPSPPLPGDSSLPNNPAYTGAFSQYSNISSTNTSKSPSPVPSFINVGTMSSSAPTRRSESAMGIKALTNAYNPINRASSALDYNRPASRKETPPPPRVASADAATTTFAQSMSFSQAMDSYSYNSVNNAGQPNESATADSNSPHQDVGWWSEAYGDSNGATPTATSFFKMDAPLSASETSSGFISLMDDTLTPSPSNFTATTSRRTVQEDIDDDDLGLGNAAFKKQKATDDAKGESTDDKPDRSRQEEPPKKPDIKPNPSASSSGSWLGRLFSRSSSTTPGPVKANLGENNDFYFDKELGKWVNKKAGAETAKTAAPPPPPSRAQTASPSKSSTRISHAHPTPMPPPPRPASALEPSTAPPKRPISRIQAELVPEESSSAPPTPAVISSLTAAPPTGRSKSAVTKRPVRSRYVDVFQAQGNL